MRLNYDVSKATLIAGCRLQNGMSQTVGLAAIAAVVMGSLAFGDFQNPRTTTQLVISWLWPLFVAFFFFVGFALMHWFFVIPMRASAIHRQNPLLFGQIELTEDEDGVELKGIRSVLRYRWADFRGFKENDRIFLLCLSKSVGYPIPKLGLSPETMDGIRQRLDQKLKRLT